MATDQYTLDGLVVSAKRYRTGRESDISPIDLALAWGFLTRKPNIYKVKYFQSGRWYLYIYFNMSKQNIVNNSANTHIVISPEDESVKELLFNIKRGDSVHLSGYLINVIATDGWRWSSSRSRSDSGNHSCELFYVTEAKLIYF